METAREIAPSNMPSPRLSIGVKEKEEIWLCRNPVLECLCRGAAAPRSPCH